MDDASSSSSPFDLLSSSFHSLFLPTQEHRVGTHQSLSSSLLPSSFSTACSTNGLAWSTRASISAPSLDPRCLYQATRSDASTTSAL